LPGLAQPVTAHVMRPRQNAARRASCAMRITP
jgi:hypothetical protein